MKRQLTMPDGEIINAELPRFKTPYNHDTRLASRLSAVYSKQPSLTKQEFKEETNINTILDRFKRTGEIPPVVLPEHFADLSERPTYFDIATKVATANHLFYRLPATTRAIFQNDPNRWADEVVKATNSNNAELLEQLGIDATRKPQETEKPTPGQGGTPAPEPPAGAPGAPKAGDSPAPPSDKPK